MASRSGNRRPAKKKNKRNDSSDEDEDKPTTRDELRLLEQPIQSFIPGEGLDMVVLGYYVGKFVDRLAQIKPGPHWEKSNVYGYWMKARFTLSVEMILDIKLDTQDWRREVAMRTKERLPEVLYHESDTARRRNERGATIPKPQQPTQAAYINPATTNQYGQSPPSQYQTTPIQYQMNTAVRHQVGPPNVNTQSYEDYDSQYALQQRTNISGYGNTPQQRMENTGDQNRHWSMQQRTDQPAYNTGYPQRVDEWADSVSESVKSPSPGLGYAESMPDSGYQGSVTSDRKPSNIVGQSIDRSASDMAARHQPESRKPGGGTLPSTTGTAGFRNLPAIAGPRNDNYRQQPPRR